MMGPSVAAGIGLAVVFMAMLIVLVQPSRAWRAAAEHSRGFWLLWILLSLAAGVAPAASFGLEWGSAAWLAACCVFGALQPAMIADVLDVRRQLKRERRARRRNAASPPPPPHDAVTPISWQAEPLGSRRAEPS